MDKEKKNGKKKLIITMAVALILLVGVTVSYGYIAILGNSKNQEISVGTGDIHLVFDDADTSNVNATLKLGESITKTFKIENKGTKPGKVQINWKNLVNTYNSRSLSYTLETSSSKDTGYTSIEALRENVPVSTEAKEVPLSKEITIPVQSTPIYYRVTITFNNLSDVDQSGDVNATLTTQFSLSEPENLSKKVIAVLDGNVKSGTPDFLGPAPEYKYYLRNPISTDDFDAIAVSEDEAQKYIVYGDSYEIKNSGIVQLVNYKVGKYSEVYSELPGKYSLYLEFLAEIPDSLTTYAVGNDGLFLKVSSATANEVNVEYYEAKVQYDTSESTTLTTKDMSSNVNNYITYADSFEETGSYGRYILINPSVCKYSECYSNLVGKYVLRPDGRTSSVVLNTQNATVSRIVSTTATSMNYYITPLGTKVVDYSTTGVYKTKDDYGDSYYYRGAITNNNVLFAGLKWKIMRINGDGSVRMILSNTNNSTGDYQINEDVVPYYGWYMYGGDTEIYNSITDENKQKNENSSAVKTTIDTWYENNLISYSNYISDTLFCNDRNTNVHTRLTTDKNPLLTCQEKNDRFTVDDETIGNGALTYPIALLTLDEVMMSGINFDSNNSTGYSYLNDFGDFYGKLTMTGFGNPGVLHKTNKVADLAWFTNSYGNVLPAINIKPEYALEMIGSGTESDPFVIPGVN